MKNSIILYVCLVISLCAYSVNSTIQCYTCSGTECSTVTSDTAIITCTADDFTTTTVAATEIATTEPATTPSEEVQVAEFPTTPTPEDEEVQFIEFTTTDAPEDEEIQIIEYTTAEPIIEAKANLDIGGRYNSSIRHLTRNDGELICITASYMDDGEEQTFRGCSVISEDSCADQLSMEIVSCEFCTTDLCNAGSKSIFTSLITLATCLLFYLVTK